MGRYRFLFLLAGIISLGAILSLTDYSYSQSSILEKTAPGTDTFIFVQTFLRDSDGNLITYLVSNEFTHLNLASLDNLLEIEVSENDPIITIDEKKYQVIKRSIKIPYHRENSIASTLLAHEENGELNIVARFAHDGYPIIPEDEVTSVWTFIRPVQ